MLQDAQNQLPDELSSRFSLNRFLAFQRDIVNDELQDNVPDLVEDALENPTGTYQQVSRFQNQKLVAIDRTTIAIKESLDDILLHVNKIYEASKNNGSGGLLDDIMKALGIGGLGLGAAGLGRRKKKTGKTKAEEKVKGKGKTKVKEKVKLKEKIKLGKGLTGKAAKYMLYIALADIGYKMYNGDLSLDDIGGELQDLGSMAAYSATDSVLTNKFYQQNMEARAQVESAKKAAAAAQIKEDSKKLLRRSDIDPSLKGTKEGSKYISRAATEAELIKRAAPKASSGFFGAASNMMSSVKSGLSNAWDYTKGSAKSSALVASAFALWDFYNGLRALPPGLSEEEYTKAISELATTTIAQTGLMVFGTFVGELVGTTAGAVIGSPSGPFASVTAIVGFLAGTVGGFAGGVAAEMYFGDDVEAIAKDPTVVYYVQQLVRMVMTSYKTLNPEQQVMQYRTSDDPYKDMDATQLAAKGLKRTRQNVQINRFEKGNAYEKTSAIKAPPVVPKSNGSTAPVSDFRAPASGGTGIMDIMGPAMIGPSAAVAAASFIAATTGITSPISKNDAANLGMTPNEASGLNKILQHGKGPSLSKMAPPMRQQPGPDRIIKPKVEDTTKKDFETMLDERFARQAHSAAAPKNVPTEPTKSGAGQQRFSSTPMPVSMAIAAMRGNGLADVYPHPLSGPTMERMDRGGETLFG